MSTIAMIERALDDACTKASNPANDNTCDPVREAINAIAIGFKFAASMDAITLRAMRENWTPEQFRQALVEVPHA